MALQELVMTAMKEAMKSKDQTALAALRAIKSEILLANTSGGDAGLTKDDEVKLLSKLVKQRKDSARIYKEQDRGDLAQPEIDQAAVIEKFLPAQMSREEVEASVDNLIAQMGASTMSDMGKVMGMANKEMAGKTDGRTISEIVKQRLGQ